MKTKTLETLEEGKVVTGVIKNITEYGAFVDLGGIDGLLHITDMSWGRVNHPSELFKVGDEVTVKVLKYNAETERVSLGLKQTQEDPVEPRRRGVPAGQEGPRQGHVDHRLRRVRRARAGRRRPHPRQRDELDQEGQAPVEAPRGRPGDRVPGARGRRARPSASARSQAARARSLDALHREVPPRRQDRRQGPLHHRLRRLHRHRRRRRRHGPQERPRRGRPRSTTRPTSTTRATTSKRSSSRSTTTRRRSPSASSSSSTIRGRPSSTSSRPGKVVDTKVVSHRRLRRVRPHPRGRRGAHPLERARREEGRGRRARCRSRSATRSRPRSPTSTRRIAASRSRCASARRATAAPKAREARVGRPEEGGGGDEAARPRRSASSSSRSSARSP